MCCTDLDIGVVIVNIYPELVSMFRRHDAFHTHYPTKSDFHKRSEPPDIETRTWSYVSDQTYC